MDGKVIFSVGWHVVGHKCEVGDWKASLLHVSGIPVPVASKAPLDGSAPGLERHFRQRIERAPPTTLEPIAIDIAYQR